MPVEYGGEEQAICAVGLVKPRPDVFVEAIQYLLVLCTTAEVCAPLPRTYTVAAARQAGARSCCATACATVQAGTTAPALLAFTGTACGMLATLGAVRARLRQPCASRQCSWAPSLADDACLAPSSTAGLAQVVLLGVCLDTVPGGGGEAAQELALQPLPLYTVPADNVTMCAVAATPDGRIFLGGSDGNLYEVLYEAGDSWRHRRCYKARGSGGVGRLRGGSCPGVACLLLAMMEGALVVGCFHENLCEVLCEAMRLCAVAGLQGALELRSWALAQLSADMQPCKP